MPKVPFERLVAWLHHCKLAIPDTITFNEDGAPIDWYFTSKKTGEVLRHCQIDLKKAKHKFALSALRHRSNVRRLCCCVCLRLKEGTHRRFLDDVSTNELMTARQNAGVRYLQEFIPTQLRTDGSFRCCYRRHRDGIRFDVYRSTKKLFWVDSQGPVGCVIKEKDSSICMEGSVIRDLRERVFLFVDYVSRKHLFQPTEFVAEFVAIKEKYLLIFTSDVHGTRLAPKPVPPPLVVTVPVLSERLERLARARHPRPLPDRVITFPRKASIEKQLVGSKRFRVKVNRNLVKNAWGSETLRIRPAETDPPHSVLLDSSDKRVLRAFEEDFAATVDDSYSRARRRGSQESLPGSRSPVDVQQPKLRSHGTRQSLFAATVGSERRFSAADDDFYGADPTPAELLLGQRGFSKVENMVDRWIRGKKAPPRRRVSSSSESKRLLLERVNSRRLIRVGELSASLSSRKSSGRESSGFK